VGEWGQKLSEEEEEEEEEKNGQRGEVVMAICQVCNGRRRQ
jgi:hypothetical protein